MPTIFIHSWWRSSSTYFWLSFRRSAKFASFYEPLHESLHRALGKGALPVASADKWDSNHPAAAQNYFLEYQQLLQEGNFAPLTLADIYGRFWLPAEAPGGPVKVWFSRLALLAEEQKRVAVFGCVRSWGRIAWMRQQMAGRHILLLRDPRDVWAAMARLRYLGDNDYFIPASLLVAASWTGNPQAETLEGQNALAEVTGTDFRLSLDRATAFAAETQPTRLYELFFGAWLGGLIANADAADVLIDVADFGPERRRHTAGLIREWTGARVSFADFRAPSAMRETTVLMEAREKKVMSRLDPGARKSFLRLCQRWQEGSPALQRLAKICDSPS